MLKSHISSRQKLYNSTERLNNTPTLPLLSIEIPFFSTTCSIWRNDLFISVATDKQLSIPLYFYLVTANRINFKN